MLEPWDHERSGGRKFCRCGNFKVDVKLSGPLLRTISTLRLRDKYCKGRCLSEKQTHEKASQCIHTLSYP